MKKILKIAAAAGLSLALVMPVFASDLEEQINEANNRQEELEAEVANSQARLEELQGSKADIEEKIAEIDAEIAEVDSLIAQYSGEAIDKEGQIEDLEGQISDQEDELQAKYEKMKIRIKYMYENLDANYIEAIFSSSSFGEFFEKVEYISALNSYDRKMMNEIEQLNTELKENKQTVEEELAVVEALGEAQEEQKGVLDGLQVMKSAELSNTEAAIEEEHAELDSLNAMLAANAEEIASLSAEFDALLAAGNTSEPDPEAEAAALEAEAEAERLAAEAEAARIAAEEAEAARLAAEETEAAETTEEGEEETEAETVDEAEKARLAEEAEAARLAAEEAEAKQAEAAAAAQQARETADASAVETGDAGIVTGAWIWPVPGYSSISSGFGPRWGSYHYGIDIPAPSGTPIVAVDGGKVVMARWDAGADTGLYVVVYHGNGIYSEYMHMSNIGVSVGQQVGQGEVIGSVGETGQAYGSHLHLSEGIGSQYWLNRVAPPF